MILLLISLLLLLPYLAILLYYRQSWLEMEIYTADTTRLQYSTFISIIIPARNEEKNIGLCIESIIKQTYPADLFEVIVVDDHSKDATPGIIASYNQDNIRVIRLKDFIEKDILNSYKKKAIEIAINLAKGTLIITTDADCIAQPKWLETIASFYARTGAIFIAAPVMYEDPLEGDSLLKKFFKIFQSLDFMTLQGITGASVYKKIHNMCNGANLAYEKKVFDEVKGFEGIDNIASGDDMLLMHKIQKLYPDKIYYLKSPEAIVRTCPAESVKEFINQRVRWASKADKYPDIKITSVLVLVYLLNCWIFFLAILSFISKHSFYLFLFLLIVKILAELFFLFPVTSFFKKKKFLWWFILSEPFHIFYTLVAGWLGKFGSYTWKDRKVK